MGIGSTSLSLGGTVECMSLGNIVSLSFVEGGLIEVISQTLIAPFTIAVILSLSLGFLGGR